MSKEMDFSRLHPPATRPSISLVLPAYNEAAVIEQSLHEASQALSAICDDYQIIVVDDGSADETSSLVRDAMNRDPHIDLLQHPGNLGYGAALRNGFAAATMDLVGFTDADCQFNLNELDRLVLLAKSYDIVCGYRIDRQDSALRCLYSRGYNLMVRCLLGIGVRDVDCALKLFRRDVVQDLDIKTNGFLVNSELLTQAKHKGHSIVEVGVSHRPRAAGESTVSIHHIPRVLTTLLRYWWNAVQFPGKVSSQARMEQQDETGWLWSPLVLLLVVALFMFTNLNYPLIDRDETRYAEIPREMLATGNWILPQLNFEPYYDKPPLLYWLCALAYSAFGVHEWTARLIPALAGLLTLAATMWFGTRWFGRRVGLWSGIALSLTAGFLFCTRYLLIDGLFTALITLSWMTAYEAIRGQRFNRGWWITSAACCGLALLAKGPLAWVLWMPPVVAYTWLTDASNKPRLRDFASWIAVSFAIAAPWFVMVSQYDPRFVTEFLLKHNIHRFSGAFHAKPIWYFIPVALIAAHPWSSLTFPLGRFLFSRSPEHASQRTPALGFLLLFSLWCLAFFSVSQCKLATYLLPIAPAAALIVGVYMRWMLATPSDWSDRLAGIWSPRIASIITFMVAAGFLAYESITEPGMMTLVTAWAVAWTMVLVLTILMAGRHASPMTAWASAILTTALLGFMVMHQLLPAYGRSQSLLGDDLTLRADVASADHILTITHEFSEIPFYLNRSDVKHWSGIETGSLNDSLTDSSQSILVLPGSFEIASLRSQLPDEATVSLIGERKAGRVVRIRMPQRNPGKSIAGTDGAIFR